MQTQNSMTGLKVINISKLVSITTLTLLVLTNGIQTNRQLLYVCCHMTYLTWWFIMQYLAPSWTKIMFQDQIPNYQVIQAVIYVGVFYMLPAFGAFFSENILTNFEVFVCIWVYTIGTSINTAVDFYKLGAKIGNKGQSLLLTQDPFRLSRFLHYFGDWLRYGTFAYLGYYWWGYIVLVCVIALNYFQAQKRDEKLIKMQKDTTRINKSDKNNQ
eukprot:TRINITY_DN14088_c0_g1_i15.p1 TRINITY_DN14088_c0_g1~~TRINITY_DN14088_c0_g1_i15.p1  ORF type:complete len:214 (+),score=6.42 TRINITY_DN14088_c0_g1_i15:68-709(+)